MKDRVILLDLDGVLTNFLGGVCRLLKLDYQKIVDAWPIGTWNIDKALGVTEDEIWRLIDAEGQTFWSTLELFPYARQLYDLCENYAPTYICSSPSRHPGSFSGKAIFLSNWLGPTFNKIVLTSYKSLLANPYTSLIDDADHNIYKFNLAKGNGIVFPSILNSKAIFRHDAIYYVESLLKEWILRTK